MKKVYLHLGEVELGELTVESVRGHETWMLRLAEEWLAKPRAMIDPSVVHGPGPQFPAGRDRRQM